MTRMYLLVFDVSRVPVNMEALHTYIRDSRDITSYWNYIPLVYIIRTHLDLHAMSAKLNAMFGGAWFLLTEINGQSTNGILPLPAWDWINAPQGYILPPPVNG